MKNILLLSIKPQYARKIFDGTKTVELRRIKPKHLHDGDLILVYESAPAKSLMGAFEVEKVVEDSINKLWEKVKNKSAISKTEYDLYFKGTSVGVGIFIRKVWQLLEPITLEKLRQEPYLFAPPQSFRYATNSELSLISQLKNYQE